MSLTEEERLKRRNHVVSVWTEERVDQLRAMYANGISCSRIAAELGVGFTRNAVIGKVHRMGLPLRGQGRQEPQPKKPRVYKKREHKAKVRIVPANGNSSQLRVIQVSETSLAELRCAEVTPRGLTLLELQAGDCRYPYGDSDFTFCGHPKISGSSYCPKHFALTRPLPSERRATQRIPTPATWRAA